MGLADIGEFGLIDLVARGLIKNPEEVIAGIGDDAAVLKNPGSGHLLLATDMLVENVHFSFSFCSYYDVGFKAVSVNASDIAAMGGTPLHAVVSLALPAKTQPQDVAEGLYAGIRQAADLYGINVVGGDTVRSPGGFVINVAVLGASPANTQSPILRTGARPGDLVCVTGSLGASAAGLHVKKNPSVKWPAEEAEFVGAAYRTPRARVKEGQLLAKSHGITAMIDVSDGLAGDLARLCCAGGVGCIVFAEKIPVARETIAVSELAGVDYLEWALYGGEDFELLFTVKPDCVNSVEVALANTGCVMSQIGTIVSGAKISLQAKDGTNSEISGGGYDHFL